MSNHKDLKVWQMAIEFVTEIYKITQDFPKHEQYGLTSQIRRSAISIPSNIAEGCTRKSNKDTVHFLNIALASSSELETQLIISKNLGYIQEITTDTSTEISKMISGLIKHYKKD